MQLKNLLFSVLTGSLLALGWPTYGISVLLFFAFVPLLCVERRCRQEKRPKYVFLSYSYLAFFVWTLCTTWWIYYSTPIGMAIAVLVNSLLMALVLLSYHILAKKIRENAALVFFVCLWTGFEYMHLHWEFSFPWLNLGNGFATTTSWIQWYEYTGTFGGSIWVLVVNVVVFKAVCAFQKNGSSRPLRIGVSKALILIAVPIVISLGMLTRQIQNFGTSTVVLLQPNINPYTEKYTTTDQSVAMLLDSLLNGVKEKDVRFVIAPETVFADGTTLTNFPYSKALRGASRIVSKYPNSNFLGGVSMYEKFNDSARVHKQTNALKNGWFYDDYNSAFFYRPDRSSELYHKTKLVVGVENFPYQRLLKPLLGDAMIDLGGTVAKKTTQAHREVFFTREKHTDSIGVGPIICYESIYGEFVTGYVRNGADFLAIITNDAWWDNTQGHKQHLAYARLRAIETRRTVVRSANTGISAIINPFGTIVSQLGYEKQGILEGEIVLNNKITFYVRYGNYIARVALFLGVLIFLYGITRRKSL